MSILDALPSKLNTTGLQKEKQPLYDFLSFVIKSLREITDSIPSQIDSSNNTTAVVFKNLPGNAPAGSLFTVTDSNTATWGAAIAGGGANVVLAFFNGTAWTVAGK